MIEYSRKNAINAGVEHLIHFQERPVSGLSHRKKYGFIITNPPLWRKIRGTEKFTEDLYNFRRKVQSFGFMVGIYHFILRKCRKRYGNKSNEKP